MSFVKEGSESDPQVTSLYKEIIDTLQIDAVPNILKTTSLDPQIAQWFWDGIKIILLRESQIPRILKESIAVIISEENSCKYCSNAHSMILQLMGFSDEQLDDLKNKREKFSPKEKAVLDYAIKINNAAYNTTSLDHDTLHSHGYNDKQIIEITSVVAIFRWANIIADALGTKLDQ